MTLNRTPPHASATSDVEQTASTAAQPLTAVPPSLSAEIAAGGEALQHSTSTPNLNEAFWTKGENFCFANRSGKRKHDGMDETSDFHVFMNSMRSMFSTFTSDMDSRLHTLHVSMTAIREQNCEITKSIDYMSNKYDEMLKRIEALEKDKSDDKKNIQSLEDKLESLERKSRSSCVEIRNLPSRTSAENKPETKEDLFKVIKTLSNTLNIKLEECEVKDVYRTSARKDLIKPLIVEFCSVMKKDNLLRTVKDFNKHKSNDNKLNTQHLNFSGPRKGVFISETLTPRAQQLFYKAREFAKEFNYDYCWTSRGLIYLRKAEKLPYVRVICENDIEKLRVGK